MRKRHDFRRFEARVARLVLARLALALGGALTFGCGEAHLGSNVLWSDDFESGDLSAWTANDEGDTRANEGSAVEVTSEVARRGRYALRLRANTEGVSGGGAAAQKRFAAPEPAYYSAWFYVPEDIQNRTSSWNIMAFDSIDPLDPEEPEKVWSGIHLNLRRLPNGELALLVFHNDRAYLQAPLAAPAATAQLRKWFHLEARFALSTEDGEIAVWLDGEPVYRFTGRPTGVGSVLQFSVSHSGRRLEPVVSELFVDDVMVSRDRVTPHGEL